MSETGENEVAANGRRSRICISCRTLFDKGQDCPGKNHRTIALRTTSGRNHLDDEVWGPDSRARAIRQAARAGAGGATLGGLFEGCDAGGLSACDASAEGILAGLAALLVVAVVAIATVVLWWLIKAIVNAIRNAADRPKPHGALLEPPKAKQLAVAARGVVRSGAPVPMPWRAGESAFAYAMELYEGKVYGGGAMLRDASTGGFEVALDDGRVLRVPAGRVRILGKRDKVETDEDRIDDFIRAIDPERIDKERTVFPYDFARAVTIGPGDRIEVLGEVDITADAGAAGYRANAGIVVPVGIPVLRVKKNASSVRVDASPNVRVDAGAKVEAADEEGDAAATDEGKQQHR